ncbi:MAG TPA: exodeoxyribonuclease VII large subunit [Candidatus Pullichristensenella avicola]|nr:exodeoxyribonuclease VII large subunit [Candidatus Pullichristensenella avicola]
MDDRWALSVTELNEYVRRKLAGDPVLRCVSVRGEVSGFKRHVSGHCYFALKDETSRVQCVLWRQQAAQLAFRPEDGMRVTVHGAASVFVQSGSYQIYVNAMEQEGLGDLYLRFEALKKALAAEGLFDPARKRELPLLPRTIGVATSRTGAVIRDIIRVARRRDPNVGVLLAPCAVQGAGAAAEIVQAIRRLNEDGRAQVILVGRGGGSIEDLWPFNEESVARAIAASRLPVISCVGHETDFTIADFVADARAATPSNAAELAVPVAAEIGQSVDSLSRQLTSALRRAQQLRCARLRALAGSAALTMPRRMLVERRETALAALAARLGAAMAQRRDALEKRLLLASHALAALDPEGVVRRGYAVVFKNGRYVPEAQALRAGDAIELHMRGGNVAAEVTDGELHL